MKRILSAVLVLAMVAAMSSPILAVSFSDLGTHWAKASVEYLAGKGVINGYADGTFKPDNKVSRVEFIKMLDETFGLTATTSLSYTDVANSKWYYTYVAKAAAQGYLLNYGTALNPDGELSRQEAAALLRDPSKKQDMYLDMKNIAEYLRQTEQ